MMLASDAGRRSAVTGADGRFRIGGLRPGAYELVARAGGRTSKDATIVGIGVAEQVAEIELLISAGPVIRGVVLDEQGAPVGNAQVIARGQRRGERTDADRTGAFVLAGLAPGDYALIGSGQGLIPAGGTTATLVDKDLERVEVRVRKGLSIAGHVEPRQRCEVAYEAIARARAMEPVLAIPGATTAADGVFELGPSRAGAARLTARCAGGDQGSLEVVVAPGMAEVVVEVTPGGSIAGRLVDGDGRPVAGASVMAARSGEADRTTISNGRVTSGVQGLTTSTGAYELKGLVAGTYRMSALEGGRPLRARGKPVAVTLAAAEAKSGVDLAIDRPTGRIAGVVIGPDGQPLADAWVSVHQDMGAIVEQMMAGAAKGEARTITVEQSDDEATGGAGLPPALTDAEGRFELTGLPHARFHVVAEAQAGKLRGRAADVMPDATISIRAVGLSSLSGTVTGPRGPAAVFTVELDGPTPAARTFTGGTFELGRVDPGDYTLRITSREGNADAKVTVIAGQPATVAITLRANAVVVGRVVDAGGQPVAGVGVTLMPDEGPGKLRISMEGPPPTSGPDGSFRIEHPAGARVLVVLTEPRPVLKRGLVLEAGNTLDVGAIAIGGAPTP